jgi:tRNA(adenine34) deaminase
MNRWRDGREAEGTGLLNLHTPQGVSRVRIPLSPPSSKASLQQGKAPLAQLDRASDYESEGQRFESSRERIESVKQTAEDIEWMGKALALAKKASELGEVPVGAIAVKDGQVIGEGFNRREIDKDPFAHAEMLAMRAAAETCGAWRLSGVTLYVTLEPCPMCAGALVNARVDRLVFGAKDPKAGAVGSLMNVAQEARLNHRVEVTEGVLGEACGQVLSDFFRALRERKAAVTTE